MQGRASEAQAAAVAQNYLETVYKSMYVSHVKVI